VYLLMLVRVDVAGITTLELVNGAKDFRA